MLGFLRVIKFAFQDIARNLGLSAMTVFILILMLLSVNTLWSVDIVAREAVRLTKDQLAMSLYLAPAVAERDVSEFTTYLRSLAEVTDVTILNRETVLKSFKDRHRLAPEVLSALNELGGNPFGPTILVKAREPQDYANVLKMLNVPEYERIIEGKSFAEHEDALERLQNITNRIEKLGFGVTALFGLIAFLIIFNTVRVAIQTQRREIGIKRLVGASNWFIRGPYLVESVLFTLLSVAATVGLVFVALQRLDPYLSVVFTGGFSLTKYFISHSLYLFGIQAVAVLVLTVVSSSLAMRRQLKV